MNRTRIRSAAVSLLMLGSSLFQTPLTAAAADNDLVFQNLTYRFEGEKVLITGCTDNPESLKIPEEIDGYPVKAVSSQAFANCTSLKSAVLPECLTNLGDRAFVNCTSLESISLPEKLTAIKHNTFNGCSSLKSIVIPDSVRYIGTGAFRKCKNLADIAFPKEIDMISHDAFTDTAWLESQPDGFLYISNVLYSFIGEMPENTELILDPSVTVIAEYALFDQRNLTSVQFHDGVTAIGASAFYDTGIVSAELPPIDELKYNSFSECRNLQSVTIPGTVKSVGSSVFIGCTALENLTIGNGVKYIGMRAFLNCNSLKSVTIPMSVKDISYMAFGYSEPEISGDDDIIPTKASDDFTLYGYPYSATEKYAANNGFRFAVSAEVPPPVKGDVNYDGSFRISDAVLMQRWLLADPDAVLKQWACGDWNEDGALNAADLSIMKQELTKQNAKERKIKIIGSNAEKLKDEVCRYLQESVFGRCSDFDFSQFSFEEHGSQYLYSELDATESVGKTYSFSLYYMDIPLDPEQYEIRVHAYYDGRYELDADFLDQRFTEKIAALDFSGVIGQQEAIEKAKAYAAELELSDIIEGLYQPSDRFGEDTFLLIYSVEKGVPAYCVSDPVCNWYSVGNGNNAVRYAVHANVYVDANTGEFLENRYFQTGFIT